MRKSNPRCSYRCVAAFMMAAYAAVTAVVALTARIFGISTFVTTLFCLAWTSAHLVIATYLLYRMHRARLFAIDERRIFGTVRRTVTTAKGKTDPVTGTGDRAQADVHDSGSFCVAMHCARHGKTTPDTPPEAEP